MRWQAIAGHVDSADDSGNLLLDDLGQATLLMHSIRVEIHLVLKKLRVVAQSLEIVRQETPPASDIFVNLPHLWAGFFVRLKWKKRHHNTSVTQ